MALETLVAPATEPVTLAQARAFLRVGTDGDDTVLTSLLLAAREAVEARLGCALVTRTIRQRFLGPRRFDVGLPGILVPGRGPATSLVAARTIAGDGTETLAPLNLVRLVDGRFVLTAPLFANVVGLSIDYQAGYGSTPASVPEAFKVAILEAVSEALIRRDNPASQSSQPFEQAFKEVKL